MYLHIRTYVYVCMYCLPYTYIPGSPTGSTHVDSSLFDPSGNFDAGLISSSHPDTKSHGSTSGRVSVQSSFVSTTTFSRQTSLGKKATQFARPNSSFPPRHRTNTEQRVFRINKGVNGFDYSNKYNVVVTGGMDRVVRVWNPYMTRCVGGTCMCLYCTSTHVSMYVRTYVHMYLAL